VTLTWVCTDPGGSGAVHPSVQQAIIGEGLNLSATGECEDNAGNASHDTQTGINIDRTKPTNVTFVSGIADGSSFYFGSVPSAPTCTAIDTLSGMLSCLVSGYGTAVGPHTLTATATDQAGNMETKTISYTVLGWNLYGFFAPVDRPNTMNVTKSGSTVPLKFQAFAGPAELTSTSIVVQPLMVSKVDCSTGSTLDTIEATATGGTSLRYEGGQFIYNWKTSGAAGSCWRVTVLTIDGSTLNALFKLK
jgi:hypothetical protein